MYFEFLFSKHTTISPGHRKGAITRIEIPDQAQGLPDFQDCVLDMAHAVAQLSQANVYFSCSLLGMRDVPLPRNPATGDDTTGFREIVLRFERTKRYDLFKNFRIVAPIAPPFAQVIETGRKRERPLARSLYRLPPPERQADTSRMYYEHIQKIATHMTCFLNAEPTGDWQFKGFHPAWLNKAALSEAEKRGWSKFRAERREAQRQDKAKKRAETQRHIVSMPEPHSGAGRTVGARPGIYKGVSMRSQLEIRFAAELDERAIRWIYEGESLGAASYLVDFYLPDLAVWVEVKGRIEARDRQVLPEVARILKTERRHRLLMYTSGGPCYVINPSGFREILRKDFWREVMS